MSVTPSTVKHETLERPSSSVSLSKVRVQPVDSAGRPTQLATLFARESDNWLGSRQSQHHQGWKALLSPLEHWRRHGEEEYATAAAAARQCSLGEEDKSTIEGTDLIRYHAYRPIAVLLVMLHFTVTNGTPTERIAGLALDMILGANVEVQTDKAIPPVIEIWEEGATLGKRLETCLRNPGPLVASVREFDQSDMLVELVDAERWTAETVYDSEETLMSHSGCLHDPDTVSDQTCDQGCGFNGHSNSVLRANLLPFSPAQRALLDAASSADHQSFPAAWLTFCNSLNEA